jgi:hypothetical protein
VAVLGEAIRVDRVLVVGRERRERHRPPFALAARLRDVRQDPEDPRLEAGAALEAADPVQDCDPRFLHDLLGHGAAAHVHARHPQHRRAVLPDKATERRLVTGAEGLDDRGLDRLHRKTVTNAGRAGQEEQ